MGSKQHRRNQSVSAGLVALLLLLSGLTPVAAQENGAVEMEISGELLRRGERLTVELFVPGSDPEELSLLLPQLPPRLTLVGEPLLTQSRRLVNSSVLSGTLIILQLQAGAPGRAVIPQIRVEDLSGERYLTEAALIEISPDGTAGSVPFDLAWRIEDSSLLLGETVPVYLEMQNLLDLRYPDSIEVESPVTGLFEEVRGLGSVRSTQVGERTLYDVPVAVFLLTPTEEGTLTLPSAEVRLGSLDRTSEALRLAVREPSDSPDSGAVGRFDYDWSLSQADGELIDTLTVTLTVSGSGNLPLLSFPPLALEGLIELERSEEISQVPTVEGYEGERSVTVRLSAGEGEVASLGIREFEYYDPESAAIRRVPGDTFTFDLRGSASVEQQSVARELSPVPAIELLSETHAFSYREESNYPLFLIGPGILLVVAVASVMQRRRTGAVGALIPMATMVPLIALVTLVLTGGAVEAREELFLRRAEQGERLFAQGDYDGARGIYRELTDEGWRSGSLYYNLGVSAYLAGSVSEAVYGLRESVRRVPGRREYRELLESVEAELGLTRQTQIPRFLDPDAALLGLLLLFNIGLPLAVLFPVRVKGQRVIGVSIFAIVTLLGSLTLLQAVRIYEAGRGVVQVPEARLRRIPEPDADTWLTLPEGTAVNLELRHQDFVLVRTGLGVQGWLQAEQLITGE